MHSHNQKNLALKSKHRICACLVSVYSSIKACFGGLVFVVFFFVFFLGGAAFAVVKAQAQMYAAY